jgi:hypothetical protein
MSQMTSNSAYDSPPVTAVPTDIQSRKALPPSQQLHALRRIHAQVDQRVELGVQLFKADEARTVASQTMVDQVRQEQKTLHDRIQSDVTRSLHTYDQWVRQVDDDLTSAIKSIEGRMDDLQKGWSSSQQRIEQMMKRAEAMLDQSRTMFEESLRSPVEPRTTRPPEPTS